MKYISLLLSLLSISSSTQAQTVIDTEFFRSPVNHEVILAGSFGELRTNHFHAGIDIKPSGKVDTIYAAADGFVSRLKTQRAGYGQAIYIDHMNGYTTVYAHLHVFLGDIGEEVLQMQRSVESYEVDFYPSPGKVMVKKGQPIGLLGNTGRSYGPHLHFEIRESATEIPVNPFAFGIKPEDNRPPNIYSVTLHGLTDKYHKTWEKLIGTKSVSSNKYEDITATIPASRAGVAIHSFDKMNKADNYNGIYGLKMWVDDSLQYSFDIDKISFDETRMINAHIDYNVKQVKNRTDILCYRLPGNRLNFIDDSPPGVIDLGDGTTKKVRIEVRDFENNTNELTLLLTKGGEEVLPEFSYNFIVEPDSTPTFKIYGYKLRFPKHSVTKQLMLNVDEKEGRFFFGDESDALMKSVDIKTKVPPNYDQDKLLFATKDDKGRWVDYGGSFGNNIYTGNLGKFGVYEWYYDDVPPTIQVGSFKLKVPTSQSTISFLIDDNVIAKGEAPDFTFDVWIDGVWYPAIYKDMTKVLKVDISELPAGSHDILVEVTDGRNNSSRYSRTFERL